MSTATRMNRAGAGTRAEGAWLDVATRDISCLEVVWAELDAFIERRYGERVKIEGERAVEVAWADHPRRGKSRQRVEEARSRLD